MSLVQSINISLRFIRFQFVTTRKHTKIQSDDSLKQILGILGPMNYNQEFKLQTSFKS